MPNKCIVCQNKYPVFARPGEKVAQHCGDCKLEGMIDVKHPKCMVCQNKYPAFGLPTDKVGRYCGTCKLDGMENIKNPKCIVCKKKQPNYAYPGDKKPQYCGDCKLEGMVDVKSRKCIVCKTKLPNFAKPGHKRPQYCGDCKLEGMVDVKHPKCIVCKTKNPNFARPGEKVAQHCGDCKLEGMVDVKHPKCIVCKHKIPVFGYPDSKIARHCGDCKIDGMQDIKNPKCIVCKNKQPNYGYPGDKVAKYCRDCKSEDMEDITHPKCKSEWCSTRIENKYEGYCAFCFVHLFPDKPMARNYKTKESAVVQYVKQQFPEIDIATDKIIPDGCSKRRPDIFIDLGYQIIIVEIDENQHTDYDCSCENKRMMQLSKDVGHRPIVFIRFNPDDYKSNSAKVTSCWHINKQGICCVKKTKQKEWNNRLDTLRDSVQYWTNYKTNKMLEVIHLFYDE